jgi:hypothetical protein
MRFWRGPLAEDKVITLAFRTTLVSWTDQALFSFTTSVQQTGEGVSETHRSRLSELAPGGTVYAGNPDAGHNSAWPTGARWSYTLSEIYYHLGYRVSIRRGRDKL